MEYKDLIRELRIADIKRRRRMHWRLRLSERQTQIAMACAVINNPAYWPFQDYEVAPPRVFATT